jgi:predicted patatin/cPLA2 family phospholipase
MCDVLAKGMQTAGNEANVPAMRLILEGGGTRAAYSAGVVHALAREHVRFDAVVGSSSGSMNAAFFATGQTDTLCHLWSHVVPNEGFISYWRLFTPWGPPGLDVDRMVDDVVNGQGALDIPRAVAGNPALYVVATTLPDGKPHIVKPNASNLCDWIRASHAIPIGYNRIVTVEGRDYVDGGVAAPVPFDLPIEESSSGPTVVILTRPMSTKKPAPNWWQQMFLRTAVPKQVAGLTMRQHELHDALMKRLGKAKERGDVIVIDPPPEMTVSRVTNDAKKLAEGVRVGVEVGKRLAERLHKLQHAPSEARAAL